MRRNKGQREVLFTGFKSKEKKKLIGSAMRQGLYVPCSVTKGLDLLVCGPNAGKAKIAKAMSQGTRIVREPKGLTRHVRKALDNKDDLFK